MEIVFENILKLNSSLTYVENDTLYLWYSLEKHDYSQIELISLDFSE